MSIMAKQGVCLYCGHDHGTPNKPLVPPVFKELSALKQQLADTQRLLAESQARESSVVGKIRHMWKTWPYLGDELRSVCTSILSAPSDSVALDAAIAKAKREENEACAKECDMVLETAKTESAHIPQHTTGIRLGSAGCAAAIRSRMADELKGR